MFRPLPEGYHQHVGLVQVLKRPSTGSGALGRFHDGFWELPSDTGALGSFSELVKVHEELLKAVRSSQSSPGARGSYWELLTASRSCGKLSGTHGDLHTLGSS